MCRSCLLLATHQILSLTFHQLLIVIESRSIGERIVNSTQIKRTFGITKTTFVIKCCHEHIINYPATRLLTLLLFSTRRILISMIKYASHVKAVHKYLDANIVLRQKHHKDYLCICLAPHSWTVPMYCVCPK